MTVLLLAVIYLAFISLGLPDALMGAAWPAMHVQLGVPVSYAGIVAMIISGGTVISALFTDKLVRRLGTAKIVLLSVGLTAFAIWGFSISSRFWMLIVFAIPFGLGAGAVDAALNNYVALNFESRHMSWLHCMWGVGISVGPYIMSYALSQGMVWNTGYLIVFFIQAALTVVVAFSLPLWKHEPENSTKNEKKNSFDGVLPLSKVIRLPGVKYALVVFFCYCAVEQTVILWGSSYMSSLYIIKDELAASFASLFCIGITIGRAISGFLTIKLSDHVLICMGLAGIMTGIFMVLMPFGYYATLAGLLIVGFGCAPIYPCMIHSTPSNFGGDFSQSVIGLQMAGAYVGITIMPLLFGFLAENISLTVFPYYLLALFLFLLISYIMLKKSINIQ